MSEERPPTPVISGTPQAPAASAWGATTLPPANPSPRPAQKPPAPAPTDAERERGRIVGLAAVGAAAVIATVVTIGIFLPAIGSLASRAIRPVALAAIPGSI